jgi:hypothetical protein
LGGNRRSGLLLGNEILEFRDSGSLSGNQLLLCLKFGAKGDKFGVAHNKKRKRKDKRKKKYRGRVGGKKNIWSEKGTENERET